MTPPLPLIDQRVAYLREHGLHITELPDPPSRGPVDDWKYVLAGVLAIVTGFLFAIVMAGV